jgi:hypothetical protein
LLEATFFRFLESIVYVYFPVNHSRNQNNGTASTKSPYLLRATAHKAILFVKFSQKKQNRITMEQIRITIFFLLFLGIGSGHLCGQQKKNTISISGIVAHFINNEKYHLIYPFSGYYESKIDPGIEMLFFRSITNNTKIGIGFNFQKGRVASYMSGLRRFNFDEISIPAILQTGFTIKEKNRCFLTAGVYGGKTILKKYASPDRFENWNDSKDFKYLENYSDDLYYMDIYFDIGYSRSLGKGSDLSLAPFIKHRANTTWLNYHQQKVHFGAKLIYSFKI